MADPEDDDGCWSRTGFQNRSLKEGDKVKGREIIQNDWVEIDETDICAIHPSHTI